MLVKYTFASDQGARTFLRDTLDAFKDGSESGAKMEGWPMHIERRGGVVTAQDVALMAAADREMWDARAESNGVQFTHYQLP